MTCRPIFGFDSPKKQMVKILREAEQAPVGDVARKHGVSEATIYAWRKRFGKLKPADVKRLRHREQENAKLNKLVAERDPEIEIMKEVAAKKMILLRKRSTNAVLPSEQRLRYSSLR